MAKTNPALAILQGKSSASQPAATSAPNDQNVLPTVAESAPTKPAKATAGAADNQTRVMVYLPPKVARKFKEMAFFENRKANDLYLEAVDQYLGLPPERWSSLRYGFEPCGGRFHGTEEAYG